MPRKFVCICEDVTEKDVRQAIDEGFADVQSLKRYSTVSMGPCQGKMCHKSYTKVISQATGRSLDAVGATTSRPPFRPTPLGAIAGPGHMPFRMTPIHYAHVRAGGKIAEVGEWKRPHSYRDPVEEIEAVRNRVGIIDVSTLGKLDVVGKDAPALLDRIYTHYFSNLESGGSGTGLSAPTAASSWTTAPSRGSPTTTITSPPAPATSTLSRSGSGGGWWARLCVPMSPT